MTDHVENMRLEHLKRFQGTLEGVDRRLAELTIRQTETHTAVLSVRREQVDDTEIVAHLQMQVDGMNSRLERIERRLELND